MALGFAEASRALVQVAAKTQEFEEACAERIRDTQDELEGVDSALRAVLAHQTHLKLPNGSFLYLKECQSSRALNETRIARAVDALTPEQCRALLHDNQNWSPVQVLSEALADNLDAECIVRTSIPSIAKKSPSETAAWRPAPPAVAAQAARFAELREQLSVMRKHRSVGKKRAAAVQAVAEPVVQAYLDQHHLTRQVVQFGSSGNTQPPLPSLPVFNDDATKEEPVAATPVVLSADVNLTGQKVLFVTRTYTSRGKAPKLNTFIDALPQSLTKFTKLDQVCSMKAEILKELLTLYKSHYSNEQGSVKKRLILKQQ